MVKWQNSANPDLMIIFHISMILVYNICAGRSVRMKWIVENALYIVEPQRQKRALSEDSD